MLERLVGLLWDRSLEAAFAVVFGMLFLCGFGLPMPEDVILVTGGVLAWSASPFDVPSLHALWSDRGLHMMALVGLLGILAGDSVIYWIGRRLGVRIAEFRLLRRLIPPEKLQEVERQLRSRGNIVVVVARYLPGLRAPTYFTVGHSRLPYWQFLLFDGLAALISAPLWVCVGFYFGDNIERAAVVAAHFAHYIFLGVSLALLVMALRWIRRRRLAQAAAPGGVPAKDEAPER
jgi:membrane protein DedA with SNARE-associated domain